MEHIVRRAAWVVFGGVVVSLVAAQLLERRFQVRDLQREMRDW